MQLLPNHEIIGVVRDIIIGEDEVKIIFSMEREIDILKLEVPKEITREILGQHIGIINIGNKYHFRRI